MENWGGGDRFAFGFVLLFGLLAVFLLWQSPRSRTGIGIGLLWRRLRRRR